MHLIRFHDNVLKFYYIVVTYTVILFVLMVFKYIIFKEKQLVFLVWIVSSPLKWMLPTRGGKLFILVKDEQVQHTQLSAITIYM